MVTVEHSRHTELQSDCVFYIHGNTDYWWFGTFSAVPPREATRQYLDRKWACNVELSMSYLPHYQLRKPDQTNKKPYQERSAIEGSNKTPYPCLQNFLVCEF